MSDYIIKSKEKDLGGFLIHRSLPTAKKRRLGPFVFLDHIGPVSIVHSERTPQEDRHANAGVTMHGVQIWVGLPKDKEECEPDFTHYPKEKLPFVHVTEGLRAKLMLGEYGDIRSPVICASQTLFMDILSEKYLKTKISSKERLRKAALDWQAQRFGQVP